ncbi:M61 family metallopeptidase [Vibrio palustris]|uniref:M61 glycyl aminopeptidase n=1 Tax=Vibrio palustris TaxID=1918946 RepID=A0A1R4B127_9VIBR|nr:PDZ domain-containing protein [Vibrio palustris]SJL82622.1 M61 glycyl aminopeptidase [Vibrio palustris]
MIHYHITAIDPVAHLFSVSMTIDSPQAQTEVWLPAWLPGSYMIRDFAKNLIGLQAYDQNKQPQSVTQLDKQRWLIDCDGSQLHLNYQVYAWDMSVRTAHLDQTHGFFNGSSVFLAVKGLERSTHYVEIGAPQGLEHWQVATTLPRVTGGDFEFGRFYANDYEALIDHPVEMGTFTVGTFEACGVRHDVVLTGRHYCHMPRLLRDLKAICETEIQFFGTPAPFERYVFMTHVAKNAGGGLEHRDSTALHCSRNELPTSDDEPMSDDYRNYLTLCCHEYFHSWNVKRIKPAVFTPFNLQSETYTPQLWAYEGITSYYEELLTYRSGCVDKTGYLDLLAKTFTRVYRGAGRLQQSLNESSFNAWTKFYKQDENAINAIVSYYTKGALFALFLDLTIRKETDGKQSLDDVMRSLWQDYGVTGIGTDDDTHLNIVSEILGRDASPEFAWLDKAEDLPLESLLAEFGVAMTLRASNRNGDQGGGDSPGLIYGFGARYRPEGLGVRIMNVANGSPAHQCGLSHADLLIAADGLQVSSGFEQSLSVFKQKSSITLHWFRDDVLMSGEMPIESAKKDTIFLALQDESKIQQWLDSSVE